MNGLALCAGVGGLELGLERVFPNFRTVAFVEGEAFAASNLVKKMEEGRLDQAPIWSDLRTFDGKPWRGKVDLISAGFPCQPFSLAGMRKGTEDERHLWPSVSRIIGEVRPSIIVLENVPGVLDAAGLDIFGDLSQMGYDLAWGIVRASEAGAPHSRARFFGVGIISNTDHLQTIIGRSSNKIVNQEGRKKQGQRLSSDHGHGRTWDRSCPRGFEPRVGRVVDGVADWMDRLPAYGNGFSTKGEDFLSNTNDEGFQGRISHGVPNQEGREKQSKRLPSERGHRRTWDRSCLWELEPRVDRVVDGVADWMDRVRACGNGVVPQQAELAIRILLNTLIENQKVD